LDLRTARLAEAPDGRGYRPRDAARARPEEADPAAPRRAPEERAGCPPVRTPRVSLAARGRLSSVLLRFFLAPLLLRRLRLRLPSLPLLLFFLLQRQEPREFLG